MAFETTHILITKLNLIGRDLTNHPVLKNQVISSSTEELKNLQETLEKEENYHRRNQEICEEWDKLLEDIYALEDDIETFLNRTKLQRCKIHRNRNTSTRLSSEEILSNNITKLTHNVSNYHKLIQPSPSSGTGVAQSQVTQSKYGQVSKEESIPPTKPSTGSEGLQVSTVKETVRLNAATIVLTDLVKKLTQQLLSRFTLQYLILTVDGTYLGKAILLWAVYNADDIKQHFHCRAWVRVSEDLGQREILHDILTKVNSDKRQPLQSPQRSLHDFLVSKRYLIVLYGVQTVGFWDNIKAAFPYSLNGSRVIVVVRGKSNSLIVQKHYLPNSRKLKERFLDGWAQSSTYLEEEYGISGVEAGTSKLAELILNPHILLFLISMKGTMGSGRTALLWPMYNAKDVKQHFQCRAWVQVPQKVNEEDILSNILEQVASVKLKEKPSVESLRKRLRNFLAQKRYLVVLYDVWTSKFWDTLKLTLPNSLNGSRVIYTLTEAETNEVQEIGSSISGMVPVRNFPYLKGEQEDVLDQKIAENSYWLSDVKEEGSSIVGFDDKIKELAELTFNSYKLHFLISVLGVAGSGKTTLVRTIYNGVACKRHFKCRAWVSVPAKLDKFNKRQLLNDLLGQLRNAKQKESLSLKQLREMLPLFLKWKRYLIVLDDVATTDTWQSLNEFFPNISNGSRVIITTQNAFLAYHINPETAVLKQRRLTDDESWKLFLTKVQTAKVMQTDINDLQLKEKILQRCLCLPLQIVLLGGLLSKKRKNEWPSLVEHSINKMEKTKKVRTEFQMNPSNKSASADTKQKQGKIVMVMDHKTAGKDQKEVPGQLASAASKREEDKKLLTDTTSGEDQPNSSDQLTFSDEIPLSDIMTLAYQDLAPSLKCCLLYLGLFPKSYEIPIRRLYLLWLAEGFVMPENPTQTPEELVEEYFEELKGRNMIEVTEQKLNGSPKKGRMPNTIYDILFRDKEKFGFFHISNNSDIMESSWLSIRRLSENVNISHQSENIENRIKRLRSYISFCGGDAPKDGVKELVSKVVEKGFGMLVVLDLEGVYKPVLSDTVGKLPYIRYLGLRRTLLDDVPQSVGNLSHLETLDIKHTFITKLPSSIWKAKELKHLYTNDIDADVSTLKQSTCGSLKKLEILWGLVIRKGTPHKKWIQSLVGLRKLKLTCNEAANKVVVAEIAEMKNLQSLNLRLIDKFNQPLDLRLEEMSKWKQKSLSQLYLLGKLPNHTVVNDFPQYLEILTLSMTHLSKDPMEMLGELKQLKVLRLYAQSFLGSEMSCNRCKFPELRVLKLWMLYKLNTWNVEEGTMPMLREVEIRCCKNLKVPDGLKTLTSLKEVTLTNMKEEFVTNVETSMGGKVAIMKNFYFSSSWD